MENYRREVTLHHDGHGLTEAIHVYAVDEAGPGGASHEYAFFVDEELPGRGITRHHVGELVFQKGSRNEEGSTPGVLSVAVLAALIDQLTDFQAGPYPSEEGANALARLKDALYWLKMRADARAERGVLGQLKS